MILKATVSPGLFKHISSKIIVGLLLLGSTVYSQTDTVGVLTDDYISGIVLDATTKLPVAAAQIQTLNSSFATTTDTNGCFKISILSKTDVLYVNAIDYNAIESPIRGSDSLEIYIYKNTFTAYYNEIDNLTGTIRSTHTTNASNEIINKDESLISVNEIIQSNMGGSLRAVNHSGNYGMGSVYTIGGLNTIYLNAQPLVVVDGVIWNSMDDFATVHDGYFFNPYADIDKDDIESISVIKDGTSIYGSKGSNGVIVINTKRGQDIVTKITANISGAFIESPKSYPMMNGDQFKLYTTELLSTQGISPQDVDEIEYLNEDPSSSTYNTYHSTTDWEDKIYKNGYYQHANISVNGGDSRALYAFSIGYTGNQGVVYGNEMQQLNTRFNADFFLTKKFDLGLNLGFINTDRNLLDDGANFYTSPTYLAKIKSGFLNPYTYTATGTETSDFEDSDIFDVGNPLAIIENSLNRNNHYRFNVGLKPVIRITPSLSISDQFDYSLAKIKERHYNPIVGTVSIELPNLGTSENCFQNQLVRNNNFFNNFQILYNHKFGHNHQLNSILGARYIYDSYQSDYVEGHNTGSDQNRRLLSDEDFIYSSGTDTRVESLATYLTIDYSYDNRYFLSAAVSVDGSSKFGTETEDGFQMFDNTWAVFPSLNAAWLVSSEKFMLATPFINLLKIRAGYGLSGNDSFDAFAKTAYFESVPYLDRANGLVVANIGNSEIQWETTTKLYGGIDLNILKNRLAISFDVYDNTTDNLIQLSTLPEIAGSGYYWTNGGTLTNKGYEASLNIRLLNLYKVKWEIGASVGHYKNNIESLPDGDYTTSVYNAEILTATNNPAGVFYGYKTDGIFTTTEEAEAANLKIIEDDGTERYFEAGDVHFVEVDIDGIIDENDKQIIGDPNPDFYGTFASALTYGNFTIDALITFSYGNDVYNYQRSLLESGSTYTNQTTAVLNSWTYEGQQTETPRVYAGDPMGNSRFSDRWIEDGSYLRLKSVSIAYNVPFKSKFFDALVIWASAKNLVTLTNYLGLDPEVAASNSVLTQGIDYGLIPQTKSYLLGIKLNL